MMKESKQLTPEQIAARKKAEDFFSDLLKPVAKEKKSKTSATPRERRKEQIIPVDPTKSEFFTAVERQYHIVTQECLSCGSEQRYANTKLIRFKALRRKDNLFIEIPCVLPPALDVPSRVYYSRETTDFCPECIDLVLRVDHTFDQLTVKENKQMSLFK